MSLSAQGAAGQQSMAEEKTGILRQALRLSLARVSLAGFVLHTRPGYAMGWVHEDICRELDGFLAGVLAKSSPRLMITMPPRHGKSELAARRFPAFALGRRPDLAIIGTSYSADLASRHNREVQRIIDNDAYRAVFPDTLLPGRADRSDSGWRRAADFFEVAGHGGSYRAAGVGGGITGMGGDILIVDDPLKDRAEADSPVMRRKVWDWYTSTLYTRLSPGGGILVIQTRWHPDDLAGRLLAAEASGRGDAWHTLSYPAIATVDEPRRAKGQALHPERYPLDLLMSVKAAIGTRDWEALYQQHPVPDAGTIFRREWLRFYCPKDVPSRFERQVISWDMAFKDGENGDFVVGQVWGRQGGEFFLLDQVRGRMDFPATLAAFVALARSWPKAARKLVEDKANGPAVIAMLRRDVPGIVPVVPRDGKTARAHAVTAYFEAGNVRVPDPSWCAWSQEYVDELLQFPNGAHDDQVDATTQALNDFRVSPGLQLAEGQALRKRFGK